MGSLVERVLGLHGLAIYLTVGLLVFAEDAVFVGFVVPGETAAILGGVAASRGNASVVLLCVIVVVAANMLRTSSLFYLESGFISQAPGWCHEAIGIAAFVLSAVLIL